MTTFSIAPVDRLASARALKRPKMAWQRGVTLVELMVGIAIGLLVVAVAMVALMASRGISGTVSDASQLQQQGAYAMRVIGNQLRQAGSLYLNPDPASAGTGADPMSPVAFETNTTGTEGNNFNQEDTLGKVSTDSSLATAFRRYKDRVFINTDEVALSRNCIGLPKDASEDRKTESNFTLADDQLKCSGNGSTAQPVIGNIAELQFVYIEQSLGANGSEIQYKKAADVKNWRQVQGVQVCLVVYGTEPVDMPGGSKYVGCDGETEVDMTTLEGPRKNRLHLLLRNTFQLRSQALLEPSI
ncbi:PilW family protein [Comamonas sp. NLF-1-9]|nr:PilW family protein [Comamonas sp. NLF-1-9]